MIPYESNKQKIGGIYLERENGTKSAIADRNNVMIFNIDTMSWDPVNPNQTISYFNFLYNINYNDTDDEYIISYDNDGNIVIHFDNTTPYISDYDKFRTFYKNRVDILVYLPSTFIMFFFINFF
jgi:hypothetical protein